MRLFPAPRPTSAAPQEPPQPGGRPLRKSHLSPGRRWLVDTMQQLGYGRIKHLTVVAGEPLVCPPPRLYRAYRLTGENDERAEADLEDFLLKEQVLRLFEVLDRLGTGVVQALDVRDGLPYGMILEENVRA
ncbi:MAG: hypothetical protein IMZ65_03635 [Planctomycetes bacterium]|nr:hypothetical protein [Planctomycetota bacterium]